MNCEKCNRKIGRSVVRIAYMTSRKDPSGKKQWSTKKCKNICQYCWGKLWMNKEVKVI